jgi:hypothetical protein
MYIPLHFTRRMILSAFVVAVPLAARAQSQFLDQGKKLLQGTGKSGAGGVSEGEIGGGLKDALKVAAQRVVGRVGKTDGFNGDPSIRIPLPGPVQTVAGPLRSLGASGMIDDLQLRMNRAAEQAAPKALGIFTDAASKMTITDARGILQGSHDAATQYFRRTTSDSLTSSFTPIVDSSLSGVGAMKAFDAVKAKAAGLPLIGGNLGSFNLTSFTVGKALDGLFLYMASEEEAIRTNPAARTTDLLKKVFG